MLGSNSSSSHASPRKEGDSPTLNSSIFIFLTLPLSLCLYLIVFFLQDHPSLRGTPLAMLAAQCNKLSNKSPPPLADAAVGKGFHPWKKSPNSPAAGSSGGGSTVGGGGGGSAASGSGSSSVGQHSPCAISAASSSSSTGSGSGGGGGGGGQGSRSHSSSASSSSTMVNITAR